MNAPQPLMNPGTILAGRWQIQDFIGNGETGEVYGVRDMHSTGTFALKLFWPNALAQSDLWSAVQQTARTASGLGVDGVARTHDFGIDANSGRPFYVAERVAWSSLSDRVRLRGPLTPAEVASAFSVLARALDAAHGIGLVHRDLKPANVFVAPENANWVRISDFGVALLRAASPPPPGWGGTAGWVAPDAADVNARSTPAMDIYSLGLITFFALSGGALHRAARVSPIDPNALWQELGTPLDSASQRAREFGAAIDPAFDPWFQRAVAPNPQARFSSVGEMASAFEAIARNLVSPQSQNPVALQGVAAAIAQPLIFQPEALPPAAAPPPPSLPTVQSAQYAPSPEPAAAPAKKRSSAPFFIAGAVICFGLTALGATALYRHHQASVEVATAESAALTAAASASALAALASAAQAPTPDPASAAASAAPSAEPVANPSPSATAEMARAAAPSTPPPSTPPTKAAVATPAAPAKAPVVTPGAAAAKPATSTASKPAASAPAASAAPKPSSSAISATAKPKPGTLSAPKKKCGSVFLPCK